MRNPRVASRYAKALVDLSVERNELDQVKTDVESVLATMKGSRELRSLIASPVVKPDKKMIIMDEIFGKIIGATTVSFIKLLISHNREENTKEVLESFISQYLVEKNIVKATVTSPVGIDDTLRKEFINLIQTQTKHEVVLEEHVNPDLIGGFVVRVGDMELDSSIAGKLKKLKREFEENPYASGL